MNNAVFTMLPCYHEQISMISSSEMLGKSESISKLPIKLLESCSTISLAKLNKFLTLYLLVVNDSKRGTTYLASLDVGVCKANKIGLKGEQPPPHFLCTLQEPYIIPGLVHIGFRCPRVSSDMLLELTSFLYILSIGFSCLVTKFKKLSSFMAVF